MDNDLKPQSEVKKHDDGFVVMMFSSFLMCILLYDHGVIKYQMNVANWPTTLKLLLMANAFILGCFVGIKLYQIFHKSN